MAGIFKKFLNSKEVYPFLIGIATGLYPLIFYYSRNFTMIDSWSHLAYFLILFILFPIAVFIIINRLIKTRTFRWKKLVLPFLNLFIFFFFLKLILYTGLQKKIIVGIFILSVTIAFFLNKHFKKWVIIQLILAIIGLFTLVPVISKNLNYSDNWTRQPDDIEKVLFKKKPNVYYIQPDGYVNFSELNRGYYNMGNSDFKTFLEQNNFKSYPGFRSNYDATLSSNSATFMMKHHFYAADAGSGEVVGARDIIVSNNAVLDAFKKNGYKTYLLTEYPYLLMNRPKMGYDFSNFSYFEVPFLGSGLENKKDVLSDFKAVLAENDTKQPKFFFIEIFNPKHIDGSSVGENLVDIKRTEYYKNLQKANVVLKELVNNIIERDPNALIMIMADHGGYVGMEYLQQGNEKTQDRDKLFSMFSSILSIHWPDGMAPEFDDKLKSSINVFRILFSYLSDNPKYLDHLQEDKSYGVILKGATQGVYELIDERDKAVFKKMSLFNE